MLDEILHSVAADGDPARLERIVDHRGALARRIGVTADRGSARRCVEHPAQCGRTRQVACLDDDEALAGRIVQKSPEQRREAIPGLAHPHHATPTDQAHLGCLVGKTRRVGSNGGAAQLHDPERVLQIWTDGSGEIIRAFARQPRIRAVEQHRANFTRRLFQKRSEHAQRRFSSPHASARLGSFFGNASLHEHCKPGYDFLVEFRDAPITGIIFADDRRILIGIEIERVGNVHGIRE